MTLVDHLSLHGGAERLALRIATSLDPERFESTLCVSRWPMANGSSPSADQALDELRIAGVRFLPLRRKRGIPELTPWLRLGRFLRRQRIDLLHTHKFGSNAWGTMTGRIARVPVVLAHEHTWSYAGNPLRCFLDRELVSRAADRFIAVSREDQRRMIEIERIDASRTLFLPIGITPTSRTLGHDVRAELGIASDAPVIGLVGNLRPQKAHHVLVRAAALLVREWPRVQILIVGDGSERAHVEQLVRELALEPSIRFLGYRDDVPEVLAAIDIAVCCSDFEGSPVAMLEYMEAALPVVSTAVGGVPDLIEQGVHGLLVPPGDPNALAGALDELLRDPQRAHAMGARGQERRRAEFDFDTMIGRLEDLYCDLLGERRAA
ncbi:MAG TPA: glycosyltransferase [Solirubrobacteraceae bacterium]|nr:glycosyltransferase [Solirubrobacteraceae bacterium]